ncbi:Holliday junction branch migration protein RuvA [Tepidibacillus infernus]|uniref:Holliday junction branch migration complex subunit RuvA n=1 Tax=Tepidibacillus decaturensis TaxID=1413211 RepID=A0A135L257_9BACI|nr:MULTISPECIES: Holliday junction branch migration protein RuvA [Tepidibacillus]KXG43082.1 hypothetical protein U473_02850 [Tepidibacillus decaturensis]GBF10019.1 Holliday junction ATP-dependent DNA helicase RuvA [Tepidibacillus sp. HK-1]
MIDFIQGILVGIEEDYIVINVNGIGYQIFVPRPESYQALLNQDCFVHTHHYFREDWMGLFGFQEKEERYLFRLLLSVSGIGPKGALAMIGQGNPNQVIQAIATEDEKTLTKMPGVGKKTAQRIILDLKDKVKGLTFKGMPSAKIEEENLKVVSELQAGSELIEALKSLGYHDQEIQKAVKALQDSIESGQSLDRLIKQALIILMRE